MKALSIQPFTRALKRYERAHDSAGGWYPDALATLTTLSTCYQVDLTRIIYAFAALSPQVDIVRNVEALLSLVHGRPYRPVALGANLAKARAILAGDLSALKGPKVTAFAQAILGKGDLVLDVWALRAAGHRSTALPSTRKRTAIVRAYESRAHVLGLTLSHYQALVWLAIRAEQGNVGPSRSIATVSAALAYLRQSA